MSDEKENECVLLCALRVLLAEETDRIFIELIRDEENESWN